MTLKSGEPFCFAGLWERWVKPTAAGQKDAESSEALPVQTIESFTIITTEANETLAPLHNRMPVIIEPAQYRAWFDDKPGTELFHAVLKSPLQMPLKIYPVSNLFNSTTTDDPRCTEPMKIELDIFEKPWWGD